MSWIKVVLTLKDENLKQASFGRNEIGGNGFHEDKEPSKLQFISLSYILAMPVWTTHPWK